MQLSGSSCEIDASRGRTVFGLAGVFVAGFCVAGEIGFVHLLTLSSPMWR